MTVAPIQVRSTPLAVRPAALATTPETPLPTDAAEIRGGPLPVEPSPAPVPVEAPGPSLPVPTTVVVTDPTPLETSPASQARARFAAQAPQWMSAWTYAPGYDQDKIDLPFPYLSSDGRMDLNDLPALVAGLRAQGADETARGMLENWLALGERYSALPGSNQLNELGRSGMPRLSSLLLDEAARSTDPDFAARSYAVIDGDYRNNWCDHYFKQTPNGLNRFCDVDYSADASLAESGGEKNRQRFHGDPMPYNPVDLNAYLYRTEKDMESLATRLGKTDEAREWGHQADERKAKLLDLCWDPSRKFFFDYDFKAGQRSPERSLAPYALLTAGVLDPKVPAEKAMVDSLVQQLPANLTGADPRDLMDLAQGLDRYGYRAQSFGIRHNLPKPADIAGQAAEAALRHPSLGTAGPSLSPRGAERLHQLTGSLEVAPAEAGQVDRRLQQLHPSLLEPGLVRDLKQRGLDGMVYWNKWPEGTGDAVSSLRVGSSQVDLGIPAQALQVAPGAVVLSANGQHLAVVESGDQLIVGDRAYPKGALKLPNDILGNFYRAGDNAALEAFAAADKSWLPPLVDGPMSSVGALTARPGWNALYDKTAKGWKELTIDPCVVPHDTASQIFNRAAVPSLGIFKTQFNWDTLFMSKGMRLQGAQETVDGMADNLLYLLKSTGRVPNAARSVYLNKSQPPILPGLVRMTKHDDEWLGQAYQLMSKDYTDFWQKDGQRGISQIDGRPVNLSRWGGANHKFAMDESGLDTTSRLNGRTLDLVSPEPNSFLYQYAKDMQGIADELGAKAREKGDLAGANRYSLESANWAGQAQSRKDDVIRYCWDDQAGMFRDYRFQGPDQGLCRDQDGIGQAIMPLWVGMLDPNVPKEKDMIERSLQNLSQRFEKDHGLTSTAEDYGHPEMQWNAPSGWAPHHVMAIEAAARYGSYTQEARLLTKWLDTLDNVYQQHHAIIERYDMVNGDLPPVQKGRYEETQGDGPGFGWTNASVPWAMVEMIGGVHAESDRLRLEPCIPPALQGQPLSVQFADPSGRGTFGITQTYGDGYSLEVKGDFSRLPGGLELLTPPLPVGSMPHVEGAEFTLSQEPSDDGKVRYRLKLDQPSGDVRVSF